MQCVFTVCAASAPTCTESLAPVCLSPNITAGGTPTLFVGAEALRAGVREFDEVRAGPCGRLGQDISDVCGFHVSQRAGQVAQRLRSADTVLGSLSVMTDPKRMKVGRLLNTNMMKNTTVEIRLLCVLNIEC